MAGRLRLRIQTQVCELLELWLELETDFDEAVLNLLEEWASTTVNDEHPALKIRLLAAVEDNVCHLQCGCSAVKNVRR